MDWRRSPTTEKFSRSRSPYKIGLGSVFSDPCVAGLGAWRGTLLSGAGGAFERGWLSLGFWVAGLKLWVSWVAMLWFWVAVSQGLVDCRGFASEKRDVFFVRFHAFRCFYVVPFRLVLVATCWAKLVRRRFRADILKWMSPKLLLDRTFRDLSAYCCYIKRHIFCCWAI
ncbi:hypothetical protein U1Q18_021685 [Sarracenia purpurea var. burkii]